MTANPIFCAIDRPDLDGAVAMARALSGVVGGLKLGLELFTAQGPAAVREIAATALPVFLDLKLHDIPSTVAGAVKALVPLGVSYLTVHAGGGAAMMRAASAVPGRPRLLAVTVLTSLGADDMQLLGINRRLVDHTVRMAGLAVECGMDGIVCSAHEAAILRAALGPKPLLVVPGIRPRGSPQDDQKRTLTPAEAQAAGADILVIGRPITAAADPAAAARAIWSGLKRAA